MSKFRLINLTICTSLLMAFPAFSFEFKGYELGMSLSSFKEKGVHEDSYLLKKYDKYNNWETKLICSDTIKSEFIVQLSRYPEDSIVVCAFKEVGTSARSPISSTSYAPSYMWLKLMGNTYSISPVFTFVSIIEGEPILSMIDFQTSSDNFEALLSTVKDKYKNPKNHFTNILQNGYGARYKNETYIWKDSNSELEIKKYAADSMLDKSSTYFFLTKGEKKLEQLIKQKAKDKSSGL